jgi:DNA helicase HerA-like ATPase
MSDEIYFGQGSKAVNFQPKFGNRHGLIAGATGTGKTVSLQVLAEGFSSRGVPVFMADVKGDLSGISRAGGGNAKLEERAQQIGIELEYRGFPVIYWDVFGERGHPVRATVSEMGPLLLSRMLGLNDTQEGVLNVAFKVADDEGLLLLDMKDLRSLLTFVADNADQIRVTYGNVSPATVGTIQRALLVLEEQGGSQFFGEPALKLKDLMRTNVDGRGFISLLAAERLMQSPRLYATFLLWLLSELFEGLPEVGDLDQPKLVFFFDEAHLLFDDAPPALVDKVEQVVRLIRSKGVGIFFISQNPLDVPDKVLGQLGNRVQHALRAFTPRDQKAVNSAADTFRPNPAFKTSEVITQLAVGEALVSFLEDKGVPMVVERTLVRPPDSRLGPATDEERAKAMAGSPVSGEYDDAIDRESAFEKLRAKAEESAKAREDAEAAKIEAKAQAEAAKAAAKEEAARRRDPLAPENMVKTIVRSVVITSGAHFGRQLVRGVLGGLLKGSKRK